MKQGLFLLLVTALSAAATAQEKVDGRDLSELKSRLEGFFSNELQAKADSSISFVQLHAAAIWTRSEDGLWLYLEKASAAQQGHPSQYIYHLYRKDDITLVSTIAELRDPLRFAGAYKDPGLLRGVTKDSLINQQGCEIYYHKNAAGDFMGATPGKECAGAIPGKSYRTTHVTVYEDKFLWWERGWNENDQQVAGDTKGGYQFIRQDQ